MWHPIETAPKDGRELLLYAAHPDHLAEGEVHVAAWARRDRQWLIVGDYSVEEDGVKVTHWAPVPAGPFAPAGALS